MKMPNVIWKLRCRLRGYHTWGKAFTNSGESWWKKCRCGATAPVKRRKP